MTRRLPRIAWVALIAVATAHPAVARATWQLLPKNSHALYSTYGDWGGYDSQVVLSENGRHWAGLGGTLAFLGDPDTAAHPQFLVAASTRSILQENSGGGLGFDTFDVTISGLFQWAINPLMRVSLGASYLSGHLGDGVNDAGLRIPPVSDARAEARFVYDLGPYARASVAIAPVFFSDPGMNVLTLKQSIEIFPFGGADDSQSPSPYLAFGLDQQSPLAFGYSNSFHAQLGAYLGNHFSNEPGPTLRAVAGYYRGADPSFKSFRLRGETTSFGYAGVAFSI